MGFFKKKDRAFYAVAKGTSLPIEEVPDEVFSTKMMGEGIAIKPLAGSAYAPCRGRVTVVMDQSKHAIGIVNEDGIEVLIHVGLDTVNLLGEGFKTHVVVGDIVNPGDLLITFDQAFLKEKSISDIIMLIVVDANDHVLTNMNPYQEVVPNHSPVITYK